MCDFCFACAFHLRVSLVCFYCVFFLCVSLVCSFACVQVRHHSYHLRVTSVSFVFCFDFVSCFMFCCSLCCFRCVSVFVLGASFPSLCLSPFSLKLGGFLGEATRHDVGMSKFLSWHNASTRSGSVCTAQPDVKSGLCFRRLPLTGLNTERCGVSVAFAACQRGAIQGLSRLNNAVVPSDTTNYDCSNVPSCGAPVAKTAQHDLVIQGAQRRCRDHSDVETSA